VAEDAGYRDAAALLAQAEKQQRLQQLYDEAKELHRTGAWSAVVGVFDRIAELDPAYPDPDGLLTAARQALAADERERGLNALLSQAVAHIDAGAWPQAVKVLEELQRQQPGYRESAALLERARQEVGRADEADRQERLRRLDVEAEDASAVGNWPRAVERLEALAAVDGAYRDTAVRLAEARRQKRLAELYAEARQHARAQEWPSVVESFAQIQALDPSYPDDEGLLQSARAAQARADQERRLAELYAAAVQAMDGGALDRAVQHLEAIRAIDPGYRDAAALLTRARSTAGGDGTVRRALVLLGGGLLAVALLLGVLLGRRPLGELLRTAATATPSAPPATATPAPTATAMPTVVPATAVPVSTPAATPTVAPPSPAATRPPAATPTPVWWIYAEEKFDKPQGLLEPLLLDSVGLTRKYEGGKYVMRKSDPALSVVLRARLPDRFADARLAIDANLEGDATNRYLALSCRDQWESDQAAGEQLSGYGLLVDPARGRLALARWDKSKETLLRGWEASTALKRGNQPNRLELSCSGTTIAARVNGTPVASVEDSGYQRGRFWIGAGEIGGVAVSGPTEARFDNLVVTIAQ
jgi:outer membrane protein assembly factor BamD (BamD/ComL family)